MMRFKWLECEAQCFQADASIDDVKRLCVDHMNFRRVHATKRDTESEVCIEAIRDLFIHRTIDLLIVSTHSNPDGFRSHPDLAEPG